MGTTIENAILPFKLQQFVAFIMEKKRFSLKDALCYLYGTELYNKLMNADSDMTDEEYESISDRLEEYEEQYPDILSNIQHRTVNEYQDRLNALYEEKRILTRIIKEEEVFENVTESVTLNEKIEKNNNSNVKDNAILKDTECKQEDIKK